MLVCTVGAAMPLLVHLLSRSRYRSVEWGAMMFLSGMRSTQQSSRVKQWGLLVIRSMMLGLLAVALARPVITGRFASLVPSAGLTTGGSATVVIIVDDSASMGYSQNGKTRLDQARAVTLQILAGLKRGDQAALLLAGAPDDQSISAPSGDLQSIASRVGDLSPGISDADFADALNHAASLLDHATGADREIYVVCDRQALSWRRATDAVFVDAWATRKSGRTVPRITVFTVGGYESDNVAVESMRLTDLPVIRDSTTEMQVRVRNFGSTVAAALPLTVWTGNRTLGEAVVTVPAGSTRQVKLNVRFPESGSFVISAAVKSTGLVYDDRLDRAVDVNEPIRVLLVSGDDVDAEISEPSVTSNIRSAIAPEATANRNKGKDPVIVTTIYGEHLTAESLSGFQVVVLADLSHLEPGQIRALEQFVYGGGGLWFCPGRRVRPEEFNQLFYRGGSGIFPAAIAMPTPPDAPVDAAVTNLDRQHPVFRFLNDAVNPALHVRRVFPATPRVPDARIIASYSTGQPFLIETRAGRGRVMMSTTAFVGQWGDISETLYFSPFCQSVVRYLTAWSTEERNLTPSQPIVATVAGVVDDRPVTVQLMPAGRREPAVVRRFEDRTEMRFFRTNSPGTYRLRYRIEGVEKFINYVVTGSRAESDLTPMTDEQWQLLRKRTGLTRVEPSPETVASAVTYPRGGRELWIDLLAGVFLLSMIELGLSRWWSHQI